MATRVGVRSATTEDAGGLAHLRLRELAENPGDVEVDVAEFRTTFTAWVDAHRATHLPFIAEAGGEVVGMAWLMLAERVALPQRPYRRCGDVQSVYVVPELRDRGVGAALMRALLAEAAALRLEHVTVHASVRAISFYERSGFEHDERWLRWVPSV